MRGEAEPVVVSPAAGSLLRELAARAADTSGLAPRECQFVAAVRASVR